MNADTTNQYNGLLVIRTEYGATVVEQTLKHTKKRGWAIYAGGRFSAEFGEDFQAGFDELERRIGSEPHVFKKKVK